MRRGAVSSLLLLAWGLGCVPPPRPPPHDAAWITSGKLDLDAQEFVLRAYEEPLAFPFDVRLSGPVTAEGMTVDPASSSQAVARRKPAELAALVRETRVRAIRCRARRFPPVDPGAWREKIDPDVRLVHAAGGACWTAVTLLFAREASAEDRAVLESLDVVIHGFDARTAIAYLPIRGVPNVAELELVESIHARTGSTESF
jgi:hypothetical protein